MSTLDFILNGVATAIASGETTLEDVLAQLGAITGDDTAPTIYPTLAEHVATVTRALGKETRDTWNTHYRRLLEGTPEFCECTCDACLDLETGCACGCRHCAEKVAIAALPDLVLRPKAVRAGQIEE
jgi:hypothetical protein